MFLFGTEISNIMLNSFISDVYSVLLQFIPLAGYISLSLISPTEYVYFAAKYVIWDAVWNLMLSFDVPRIVLIYFHLVMNIFLRRAPLYVANVSKHSAEFFMSIVGFFLKIIVPT